MDIREFFRTIQWGATLQVAAIRVGVASIIWTLFMLVTGSVPAMELLPTVLKWILLLSVFIAIAIPAIGLAKANVPLVGIAALPAWLIVVADPLVKILHSMKPEWIPVDEFKLINPPVLALFGEPQYVAQDVETAPDFDVSSSGLEKEVPGSGLFDNLPSDADKR